MTQTASPNDTEGVLRAVLIGNVLFTSLAAAAFVVFGAPLAEWAELPAWVVVGVGLFLVPSAAIVATTAHRRPLDRTAVRMIAGADLAWVAVAVVILAVPGTMPVGAKLAFALLSLTVLCFGLAEAAALRSATGGR